MILWRLWYDLPGIGPHDRDNLCSYYDNTDGPWEEAPSHGVLLAVHRDSSGAWGRFTSGWVLEQQCSECGKMRTNEFFVKAPADKEPQATPNLAPFRDKMAHLGYDAATTEACIKSGRIADQDHWNAVNHLAATDPDFPKSSPRRRRSDFR